MGSFVRTPKVYQKPTRSGPGAQREPAVPARSVGVVVARMLRFHGSALAQVYPRGYPWAPRSNSHRSGSRTNQSAKTGSARSSTPLASRRKSVSIRLLIAQWIRGDTSIGRPREFRRALGNGVGMERPATSVFVQPHRRVRIDPKRLVAPDPRD